MRVKFLLKNGEIKILDLAKCNDLYQYEPAYKDLYDRIINAAKYFEGKEVSGSFIDNFMKVRTILSRIYKYYANRDELKFYLNFIEDEVKYDGLRERK